MRPVPVLQNTAVCVRLSCPPDCICDDTPNMRVEVDRERFMARPEIEYPTTAAPECAPASKHFASMKPGKKHQLVRRWNVEGLAIHLRLRNFETRWQAFRHRMRRGNDPHTFRLALRLFTPCQIATGTHQSLEDLRMMARMKDHKSHSGENPSLHAVNQIVGYVLMGFVPPPYENIRRLKRLGRKPVIVIVKACRSQDESFIGNPVGDRCIHAARIHGRHVGPFALDACLRPDCHTSSHSLPLAGQTNLIHHHAIAFPVPSNAWHSLAAASRPTESPTCTFTSPSRRAMTELPRVPSVR